MGSEGAEATRGMPATRAWCAHAGHMYQKRPRLHGQLRSVRASLRLPRSIGCVSEHRMSNDERPFTVVYTGFDAVLAGMLQRMLDAENIECRHVGTHYPAEIGVGALACEQRLEVAAENEEQGGECVAGATRARRAAGSGA